MVKFHLSRLMVLFMPMLAGCNQPSSTVLHEVVSPDHRTKAFYSLFVNTGRGSDTYHLDLVRGEASDAPKVGLGYYGGHPLYVTNGAKINIDWIAANNLRVTCDHCGIRPIDLMRTQDKWKDIQITYVGFPTDDYKSCEAKNDCMKAS